MSTVKRKIGINFIAGITIGVILIAAIAASGLYLPKATGTIIVSIKDAPVELEELWITVSSVQIQKAEDESWLDLTLDYEKDKPFDLLDLTDDKSLQLSQDDVPPDEYTKIRLEVKNPVVKCIDINGEEYTQELIFPPNHIDIIVQFTIEPDTTTGLMIDMQPDTTAISQSGNFKPVIKIIVTPQI